MKSSRTRDPKCVVTDVKTDLVSPPFAASSDLIQVKLNQFPIKPLLAANIGGAGKDSN